MNEPMSLLFYGEGGRVLSYRPNVGPGQIHHPPADSRGILELGPDRLKPRSYTDEATWIGLPPNLCEAANRQELAYRPGRSTRPPRPGVAGE